MMAGENGYYSGGFIKSHDLPDIVFASLLPITGNADALNRVVVFGVNPHDCDWHSGLR